MKAFKASSVDLRAALGLALFSVLAAPGSASAFCRTTTCAPPTCPLDPVTGCPTGGPPLFWRRSCVSFSLDTAASTQVDLPTATALAHQAFATWNAVRCGPGDGPLAIQASDAFGPVDCGHREYNLTEGNANAIIFRDDEWPYEGAGNTLALTTVSFNSETGEILDADMEINGTYTLLTPGLKGAFEDAHDLLSIMTHEAGHFLGLAHSTDQNAVMQISLPPSYVRTTLDADDIAAICTAYPQGRDAPACNFSPENGFAAQCGLDPTSGGACGVGLTPSPSSHEADELPLFVLLATGLPWLVRRRRRRQCTAVESASSSFAAAHERIRGSEFGVWAEPKENVSGTARSRSETIAPATVDGTSRAVHEWTARDVP